MTTTHPSPSVGGTYAIYNLPTTSILWAAAMMKFKTSPNRLVDRATAYEMEVSTEQNIMTNSTNNVSAGTSMNSQMLEEVTSFKYLGATLCKDGTCSAEIHIMIALAIAVMARLNRSWRCNTVSFASKFKLYKPLVTSILL